MRMIRWIAVGIGLVLMAMHARGAETRFEGSIKTNVFALYHTTTNIPTNFVSDIVVRQGCGMAFSSRMIGAGAGNTGTIGCFYSVSPDGTNFTTHAPICVLFSVTGLTPPHWWTNLPASVFEGAAKIRLTSITCSVAVASTTYLTNLWTTKRY